MSVPKSEVTKTANQSQKALAGLRRMVLGGALTPGERLFEVPLTEQLGLSRTPVREALSRLANEGLLERNDSGGYLVRKFTLQEVIDALELRGVLEGTAARFAAERGVEEDKILAVYDVLKQIDEALKDRSDQVQFDRYVELNTVFHAQLAEMAGSKLILAEIKRLALLPFASPSAFVTNRTTTPEFRVVLAAAQAQHYTIIDAIEKREGSRAEAITREHARIARKNLEIIMRDQDGDVLSRLPELALMSS